MPLGPKSRSIIVRASPNCRWSEWRSRVFPSPGRRPAHHNAAAGGAHKIEGPCGVLFFRPVAEEWNISKADGEPADFGHDMERHQEVENDGKYAGSADERIGITVTCHLDILIIKVVEKREVRFVAVADVCIHERVVQIEFGLSYLGGLFLFIVCPVAPSGFTHQT